MPYPADQTTGATILVADDQAANRELLEALLVAEAYQVISVSDGEEALSALAKYQIDLLLLDVMMPRLNGFEVCERIKANPETDLIPAILVTSLADKEDRIRGIKAGADDFLTRPVDRAELLARVRSLLKLKMRTDELERAESVLFTLARSIEGKDPYTRPLRAIGKLFSAARQRGRIGRKSDYGFAPSRGGPRCGKSCRSRFHSA
jgi:putative two-component system response regulator